jgi:hypothetical protein
MERAGRYNQGPDRDGCGDGIYYAQRRNYPATKRSPQRRQGQIAMVAAMGSAITIIADPEKRQRGRGDGIYFAEQRSDVATRGPDRDGGGDGIYYPWDSKSRGFPRTRGDAGVQPAALGRGDVPGKSPEPSGKKMRPPSEI